MGNRRFKLSEMIPTAWLFNLTGKPHAPPKTAPPFSPSRKSYHFSRDLNLKSSEKKRSCHGDEACVVVNVDSRRPLGRKTEDSVPTDLRLPPIKTERSKPDKFLGEIDDPIKKKKVSVEKSDSFSVKVAREGEESMACSVFRKQGIRPLRRPPTVSPRFRVRVTSPRGARRLQVSSIKGSTSRKSILSESLAVVKFSSNPRKDFQESMIEMIIENRITAAKDLEELLACYLSLNSNEFHDVIIQVFKQIWIDLINIRRVKGRKSS